MPVLIRHDGRDMAMVLLGSNEVIGVDAHGYLVARGDFDAPVGPDDWYRPI